MWPDSLSQSERSALEDIFFLKVAVAKALTAVIQVANDFERMSSLGDAHVPVNYTDIITSAL